MSASLRNRDAHPTPGERAERGKRPRQASPRSCRAGWSPDQRARSGDAVALSATLGTGTVLDETLAEFAVTYADQNEVDHRALVTAIADGRIVAESGI
jgi:hypothetical protein